MNASLRVELGTLVRVVILARRPFAIDIEARENALSAIEADSFEVFEVRVNCDLSLAFQAAS